MKRIACALLILALLFSLSSCRVLGEVSRAIGFGDPDYSDETVIRKVPLDEDVASEIVSMIKMLSIDSVKLPEFSSTKDAITLCHDSLLNYMLYTDYAKYAGNPDLLADVDEEYPDLAVSQIIPASEFESMMYRCFGGTVKISHGDTRAFKYLPRVAAYIPIGHPISDAYDVTLTEIEETRNTYRVSFECSNGKRTMRYSSTLVKREDGTIYFASVKSK